MNYFARVEPAIFFDSIANALYFLRLGDDDLPDMGSPRADVIGPTPL